ncbi:MAG: trigger factor [Candidatus Buchananbacteria bacterium]
MPGFEEELIGLGKDETKQFQLKFPQNYHQKNLAGKLVDFKVKMNAVYQLDLPELNDEFTKRLGEFKDLAELKDRIAQNIRDEAEVKENQKLEEEMIDKIIEVSTFDDVPDILINSETNKMVEELEHNLAGNGLKFDDYLVHLKKTREELLLDFVPQAIKRVKSAIIIRRIAEIQKITVTDKELDNEVEKTISMYGHDPEVLKNIKQPAYRSYLRNILTARKVIDYFKSVIIVSKA